MKLDDKIANIRGLIAQRDDIDRQIAECLGDAALSVPPTKKFGAGGKGKRGRKLGTRNKTERDEMVEAGQLHGRSRLDPSVVAEIEQRLISGDSVAVILENVDVSAPTVYVIKARLKKEGRLQ